VAVTGVLIATFRCGAFADERRIVAGAYRGWQLTSLYSTN